MGSLARRLEKEKLEKDLAARKKDYEAVGDKHRHETNPSERNSLQSQLERLINEIENLEERLKEIKISSEEELIEILRGYFEQEKLIFQKAYRLSLPDRLIDKELPSSLEALISNLQLPQQQESYSFQEKFIGNLFIEQNLTSKLKRKLKEWAEENIKDCHQLLIQLNQERAQRSLYYPALLVAISEREGGYIVEAWLIENLTKYKQYSSSDCEQITIDRQAAIPTNETLSNVPELLKQLIAESYARCQHDLKQIHIFLPAKLMNHAVDCWQNLQADADNHDYLTTIGEDYEVIIRCSERLRGQSPAVVRWRDKANILKFQLAQSAQQIFMLGDSNNPKILWKKLKQQEQAIAVKIPTVFPKQEEPGTLLWQAAVPLALWIRQQLPDIENQLVLDELLQDCCLKDVPNQVKNKRLDATDCDLPENHIGRHLCLLWDDPNLLPPEQLLTPNKL
ncbi:VMAP-C domain-containing protein [Merismopedia glauca]|uniref:Uncharacterized protein n=1 Tax=Merismopedia glauca CCAP 1448/3 TaxID=1296344 RepID=A0A2T1C0D5_9CYAN|nr:hypothetical protein [Merismopedia glauca]PSB01628.1 hypothetical protein C7B64_17270 [Merismopedia glauca CCAP 1448/3]